MAPPFLTSPLDGGKWSASLRCRFTPEDRAPGVNWIGDWVGPRAGLDSTEKKLLILPGVEPLSPSSYNVQLE
jgi:hypothetical protein